jgi:hypothetical protein
MLVVSVVGMMASIKSVPESFQIKLLSQHKMLVLLSDVKKLAGGFLAMYQELKNKYKKE